MRKGEVTCYLCGETIVEEEIYYGMIDGVEVYLCERCEDAQ